MKKMKSGLLVLMTVAVVSVGLHEMISKEFKSLEKNNVIPVQYEHGRGI
ncbi:hypothetical protein [Bacillus sp. FSL K6-2944]